MFVLPFGVIKITIFHVKPRKLATECLHSGFYWSWWWWM